MDLYKKNNFKPMLLSEKYNVFNDKNYIYEIKFDGIRALIFLNNNEIIIKSRNGLILNKLFPELLNIKNITKNKCIFDGEIVLMDNGIPSFSKLQERIRLKNEAKINYYKKNNPVSFVCFDILYENNNLIDLELLKRKKILNKYKDTDMFIKSRSYKDGIKLFKLVKENNLEGIVAKLKNSKYIPDIRTKEWIKIKNIKSDNFYICGYKEKELVVSLLIGEKINNKLNFVSKVIIGKKNKDFDLIKKCKKTNNKFINFYENDYIFIESIYKCNINYIERTKNNHLRHPVYNGIIIE